MDEAERYLVDAWLEHWLEEESGKEAAKLKTRYGMMEHGKLIDSEDEDLIEQAPFYPTLPDNLKGAMRTYPKHGLSDTQALDLYLDFKAVLGLGLDHEMEFIHSIKSAHEEQDKKDRIWEAIRNCG
jgi:hypothetical protein